MVIRATAFSPFFLCFFKNIKKSCGGHFDHLPFGHLPEEGWFGQPKYSTLKLNSTLYRSLLQSLGHFENKCFSIIITSRGVIIARYDAILDQSERAHLYNHLSNYTKNLYDNSDQIQSPHVPKMSHFRCLRHTLW